MLPNLLPVAPCQECPQGGFSHSQTACEPASQGGEEGGGSYVKSEVSCD